MWTAKKEISENADVTTNDAVAGSIMEKEISENTNVTTNDAVAGSIMGAMKACAQESKKVQKKARNINASFDTSISFSRVDADL